MKKLREMMRVQRGFTIVELLIVISIIGLLATITIVGYGAWRHSVLAANVKAELEGVAAAMQSEITFNNTYPALSTGPLSGLDKFVPGEKVSLSVESSDSTSYCIDGTSTEDSSITFYIASEVKDQGPQEGICATRPTLEPPATPTGLAIQSLSETSASLSWDSVADASGYSVQCASDAGFIFGLQTSESFETTTSIGDLTPSTTIYCRAKAFNNSGNSDWTATISANTDDYVAPTNNYDGMPIATSIEGYWTTPPTGYLIEDGSAISRTTYADLFDVIGTTFGAGDGSTTFNLPDSRGRVTVNKNSSDTQFDALGEKYGEKTHTLSVATMPAHTHIQNSHDHNVRYSDIGGLALGSSYNLYRRTDGADPYDGTDSDGAKGATATNQNTGGDEAHNNIQPSMVKNFAIKYATTDPSKSTLPAGSSISGYWTAAPSGYSIENGSAISRTTYAALFAVIGTTFGAGDGSTTFNKPDSRGRTAVNKSSSDSEFDALGETYGAKTHTLTIGEMPVHTHVQNSHDHSTRYRAFSGVSISCGSGCGYFVLRRNDGADSYHGTDGDAANARTATNQNTGSGGAHNNIQPSITKLTVIKLTAAATGVDKVDPDVGDSISGYWSSVPTGFLAEDGSAVSRSTYANLFAVIGTTFGAGNGSTTFNLPDSRGRAVVNRNPSDAEFDVLGEKYGAKTHTLTTSEMPSHTHTQNSHDHGVRYRGFTSLSPATGYFLLTTSGPDDDSNGAHSTTATNQNTGSGGAHNNIQPSIVKLYAIKY